MLKYNIKENISKEAILYLRTLDNEFADDLKAFLNKEKYSNIIVKYDILVQDSTNESNVYHVSCNASSSIPESYNVARAIDVFLKKRNTEMSEFIPTNLHVVFSILFSLKQSKEENKNNDYGQSKQSELPYYAPIKPRYNFNQIILPDSIRQQIKEAICIINNKDLIYNTWGFSEVDSIPKSILNFYGPPGTGKTMCAHAIANELGKRLLALNYSEIESKFVGDAPKNLQRAFQIATEEDCVLFFDEADSFLGKRIQNINQSADQALNSLRSQMLILLEEHSGVVIFATNLVSNFDKAFQSRILKHIKFELPNEEARIAIIRKMIPTKLPLAGPLADQELKELGEMAEGFSGREMKNAILDTLLAKASEDNEAAIFTFSDFKKGFENKKEEMEALKKEISGNKLMKIKKAFAEDRVNSAKRGEQEELLQADTKEKASTVFSDKG